MEINHRIRKALKRDSARISRLIIRTLKHSNSYDYEENEIERLCKAHSCNFIANAMTVKEFFVAESDGDIKGCAALVFAGQEPGTALVTTVFVHPGSQGQGTGKSLMSFAENVARSRNIRTLILYSSLTAHEFYIQLGYIDIKGSAPALTDDGLYAMYKSIS